MVEERESVVEQVLQECGDSESEVETAASEFIAFEHPEWSDKPLIGQVVKKSDSLTMIQWWEGRYRGVWHASFRENAEAWLEDIENGLIVHTFFWDTQSTKCRLQKQTVKEIREAYNNSNYTV